MEALSQRQVTQLLLDWSDGDNEALNRLISLVYEELKRMAEQLNKAYEERAGWIINIKIDPLFDPLRSDPRFCGALRLGASWSQHEGAAALFNWRLAEQRHSLPALRLSNYALGRHGRPKHRQRPSKA